MQPCLCSWVCLYYCSLFNVIHFLAGRKKWAKLILAELVWVLACAYRLNNHKFTVGLEHKKKELREKKKGGVRRSGKDRGHSPCSPIMNTDWVKSSSALHSTSHSSVKPAPPPLYINTYTDTPYSSSNNSVSNKGRRDTRRAPSWVLTVGIGYVKREGKGVLLQQH